jgi:hypothetical protein
MLENILIILFILYLGVVGISLILWIVWGTRKLPIAFTNLFISTPILFLLFLPFPFLVIPFLIGYFIKPVSDAVDDIRVYEENSRLVIDKQREMEKEENAKNWENSSK